MGFLDNAGLGTLWKNIVGKSIPYGYCTTGASTRAKTVTVSPAITELTAGIQILVKFKYANTATTSTSSPVTLDVNGLGAKGIKIYGTTNISSSAATSWNANSVVLLTYDGAYWQLTDYNNTTYSGMTDAEVNAGTSGANRLITPARLKYAIQHWSTGGSEPTMQTLSVTSGGSGTWHYRIWPSGWQEAWYQGSIQFTAAATSAGGWYRSTKNFALPISFADEASILVSGATSGRVYTHGGIKINGTQFEAQILGGASLAANTYAGWSVYVAGYGRS